MVRAGFLLNIVAIAVTFGAMLLLAPLVFRHRLAGPRPPP